MNLSFVLGGILGPTEIILIVLVVVLMFGGKKIPELMRGLGKGIREFKRSMKEIETEVEVPPKQTPSQPPKEISEKKDGNLPIASDDSEDLSSN